MYACISGHRAAPIAAELAVCTACRWPPGRGAPACVHSHVQQARLMCACKLCTALIAPRTSVVWNREPLSSSKNCFSPSSPLLASFSTYVCGRGNGRPQRKRQGSARYGRELRAGWLYLGADVVDVRDAHA
eukprot:359188-Chlamydomonas_euryale.AAC.6